MSHYRTVEDVSRDVYEYLLPDHWIRKDMSYWQIVHDSYVNYVINKLKYFRAKNIVEIGCGDGWNCGQAVKANMEVVGFDWSKNGVEHATRMVPEGKFICADIRDEAVLNEYKNNFDAAMFIEVIEHIPPASCENALLNIRELLHEDGILMLTTPSINVPNNNPQHYRHFSAHVLSTVIQNSGFRIEHITGYGDIRLKRKFWKLSRFIDNRFWLVKPIKKKLLGRYAPSVAGTPIAWSEGLIVTARKNYDL